MDRISKWEVLRSAPDRVHITSIMYDTCLFQIDVKYRLINIEFER